MKGNRSVTRTAHTAGRNGKAFFVRHLSYSISYQQIVEKLLNTILLIC